MAVLPNGHQHGNITMPLHVEASFVMMNTSKHLGFSPMIKIDTTDCISARKSMPIWNVLILPRVVDTSVEYGPFIESPPHMVSVGSLP